MDYIYFLLLQFKFILFSFSINLLLFPTVKNSHWSNYFTKLDDVDFYSQLSLIYMYSHCTECVDKVRYLPSVKSFTCSTFSNVIIFCSGVELWQLSNILLVFLSKNDQTPIFEILFLCRCTSIHCVKFLLSKIVERFQISKFDEILPNIIIYAFIYYQQL